MFCEVVFILPVRQSSTSMKVLQEDFERLMNRLDFFVGGHDSEVRRWPRDHHLLQLAERIPENFACHFGVLQIVSLVGH